LISRIFDWNAFILFLNISILAVNNLVFNLFRFLGNWIIFISGIDLFDLFILNHFFLFFYFLLNFFNLFYFLSWLLFCLDITIIFLSSFKLLLLFIWIHNLNPAVDNIYFDVSLYFFLFYLLSIFLRFFFFLRILRYFINIFNLFIFILSSSVNWLWLFINHLWFFIDSLLFFFCVIFLLNTALKCTI